MAVIMPFRGLRYNTRATLDLALVTAPPYDCISPSLQNDLYEQHPYNIVRLILGRNEPDDGEGSNRYTRAAALLKQWTRDGVLMREDHPALYLLEQEFTAEGRTTVRRGFVARVALEEFGKGSIHPHERTFSAPREDRLRLLQATRCNLSQVLALYPDPSGEVMGVFDRFPLSSPDLVVTDHAGIVNRMWVIPDESASAEVAELMLRRPMVIADGHHRYTTALAYRQMLRDQGEDVSKHHPANYTSVACIAMSDPGLVVFPNHRIVRGAGTIDAEDLREQLREHFTWNKFTGADATSGRMAEHLAERKKPAFGIYLRGDQAGYVATLRNGEIMASLVPDHSPGWRNLDVAVLHELVLGRLLIDCLGDPAQLDLSFEPWAGKAFDAVHENGATMALLVRPAPVDAVRGIATSGELLPQKSTFFFPKLLTGLVMNPLD